MLFRKLVPHAPARGVQVLAIHGAIRPGEVDEFEKAGRVALFRHGLAFVKPVIVDDNHLAWLDLPDKLGADDVLRARFGSQDVGRLAGMLALADPTHSGSVAVAYNMVVQRRMADAEEAYRQSTAGPDGKPLPLDKLNKKEPKYQAALADGWHRGMGDLQRIAANGRYFTFACGLGLPMPEDIPLVIAGIMVAKGKFHLAIAGVCAWCGIIGGDVCLYHIGKAFGMDVLVWAREPALAVQQPSN